MVGVARLHRAEHLAVSIRQTSQTAVNKPSAAAVVQTISSTTKQVGEGHPQWTTGENTILIRHFLYLNTTRL